MEKSAQIHTKRSILARDPYKSPLFGFRISDDSHKRTIGMERKGYSAASSWQPQLQASSP